jgi:hypothetical protein
MPLKYKFYAAYNDGSLFIQNDEDVSVNDPARSAFSDVEQERLEAFALVGEDHIYAVDLTNGTFVIDGVPFRMHEEQNLRGFRLIFFRRHTHTINAQYKELTHQIVYRLGWQATDAEGRNHQRVMELD